MRSLSIFLVLLSLCATAFAQELTVRDYIDCRLEYRTAMKRYLDSVYIGFTAIQNGLPRAIRESCPPAGFNEKQDLVLWFDAFLALTLGVLDFGLGEMLMVAINEKFPCYSGSTRP